MTREQRLRAACRRENGSCDTGTVHRVLSLLEYPSRPVVEYRPGYAVRVHIRGDLNSPYRLCNAPAMPRTLEREAAHPQRERGA